MSDIDWTKLYSLATNATLLAYSPYSDFPVGAAGICVSGKIVTGCNVENASYGMTLCAECGLVSNMHASGEKNTLVAVAIVNKKGESIPPCGRCRQLLLESGRDNCLEGKGKDILVNEVCLEKLLPDSFDFEQIIQHE